MSSHRAQLGLFVTDDADRDPLRRAFPWLALLVGLAAAVAIRVVMWPYRSIDFTFYVEKWHETLRVTGRRAFQTRFADYNPPYLYLLWLGARLGLPALVTVKLIAGLFDVILCLGVYRVISWLRGANWGALAAVTVALVPTVWLNSGVWGQMDSTYTGFVVLALSAVLRGRQRWAWLLLGVGVAFKVQAIFFLPFLGVAWLMSRRRDWFAPLFLLLGPLLSGVPALLSGMPLRLFLSTYAEQAASVTFLSSAPNLLQVFQPGNEPTNLDWAGLLLGSAVIVLVGAAILLRRAWHRPERVLAAAAALTMLAPFLLPHMRERYYFASEILVILLVMVRPRLWWLATTMESVLLLFYAFDLYRVEVCVPKQLLSLVMGAVVAGVVAEALGRDADAVGGGHPPAEAEAEPEVVAV